MPTSSPPAGAARRPRAPCCTASTEPTDGQIPPMMASVIGRNQLRKWRPGDVAREFFAIAGKVDGKEENEAGMTEHRTQNV